MMNEVTLPANAGQTETQPAFQPSYVPMLLVCAVDQQKSKSTGALLGIPVFALQVVVVLEEVVVWV